MKLSDLLKILADSTKVRITVGFETKFTGYKQSVENYLDPEKLEVVRVFVDRGYYLGIFTQPAEESE